MVPLYHQGYQTFHFQIKLLSRVYNKWEIALFQNNSIHINHGFSEDHFKYSSLAPHFPFLCLRHIKISNDPL